MAGKLKARTTLTILSGGYPGEDVGATGGIPQWTEVDESSSTNATYYYHDSDTASNSDSSKVDYWITERWTYTIDENNYAHVVLKSTLISIDRNSNHVSTQREPYRNIKVWDKKGGRLVVQKDNDFIASNHIIFNTRTNLDDKTFTIAPGGHTSLSQLIYVRNNTVGHDSDPVPSQYVDEFAIGIEFMNDLPPDYRPGAIRNSEGKWLSHNRSNGESHILLPSNKWKEMRTLAGHSTNDNPPSIRMNDKWTDQLKIGKE